MTDELLDVSLPEAAPLSPQRRGRGARAVDAYRAWLREDRRITEQYAADEEGRRAARLYNPMPDLPTSTDYRAARERDRGLEVC